jgi:hypothetical protein
LRVVGYEQVAGFTEPQAVTQCCEVIAAPDTAKIPAMALS